MLGTPPWVCCPLRTSCLPRGQAGEVEGLLGLGDVPTRPGHCCCTGAGHRSITPEPHTFSPAGSWLSSGLMGNQPDPLWRWGLGINTLLPSPPPGPKFQELCDFSLQGQRESQLVMPSYGLYPEVQQEESGVKRAGGLR